jgi:putative DNA primase/helicase
MIPQSIVDLKQWVAWKYEPRADGGKPTKIPYNPKIPLLKEAQRASSVDSATWGTYTQATTYAAMRDADGIGIVFANGLCGVDIDGCVDDTGEITPEAIDIANMLDSYTEYSPSKTGLHILCWGKLPEGRRRYDQLGLEMYDAGRYFTFTGHALFESDVLERTDALAAVHAKYMPAKERPTQTPRPAADRPMNLEDSDLLDKARRNKKTGMIFERLWSGNWQGRYQSQSSADMALCNLLAFWTARDAGQMDRLFRLSGLMRDKWDENRGGQTYGELTVNEAVASCREVYSGIRQPARTKRPEDAPPFDTEAPPEDAAYYTENHDYHLDDTGNAQRFRALFGKVIRWSFVNRVWYYWNGVCWTVDQGGVVRRMAERCIDKMEDEFRERNHGELPEAWGKFLKKTRNSQGKSNLIDEARQLCPVMPDEMDSDPYLLNCLNGKIDLRTGLFHPHDREDYMTRLVPVEYDPEADDPGRWISFLTEIMGGDVEMVRFLQKAIGYSLTGSCDEQCMFFLFGTGANGKSVFLNTVKALMGDYAMNAQTDTIMARDKGSGGTSDLARLKGARLVTTEEAEEGRRLSEALLKQLTGGGEITCRFLYGTEFQYTPQFKIWVATNHKPYIRGVDDGIWRRIRLVPFSVTFPPEKRDKDLLPKLLQELPGILRWAVDGALMWQQEGLQPPATVEAATRDYRAEMDVLAAFLAEYCAVGGEFTVQAGILYEFYARWAKDSGEYAMSSTRFAQRMKEKGFEKRRLAEANYWFGIKLAQDYSPEDLRRMFPDSKIKSMQQYRQEKMNLKEASGNGQKDNGGSD